MTRVKFCGITRAVDANAAVELGANALGFVQAAASPRFVEPDLAAEIRSGVPASVLVVALFQDADAKQVRVAMEAIEPDVLQFHGDEPPAFCEQFGLPYWKAVAMADDQDLARVERQYEAAQALLLDAHSTGAAGGTGRQFDWDRVGSCGKPLVLAGGLHPGNVADGIRRLRPWAVDVSSGIESRPGIKDQQKMSDFIAAVRGADGV